MRSLIVTPLTFVFVLLIVATALSWFLSATAGEGNSALLIVIAFFKVRLVVIYFMEAKQAPAPLRWMCEGVVVTIGTLVIAFYLYGDSIVKAGFPVT